MTKERYAKWLVSIKYILDQSDVDNELSRQSEFCESVILKEAERVTDNQRLLLECETARVKEKRQLIIDRQKLHKTVVEEISEHTKQTMLKRLSEMTVLKLFGRFPDWSYFLDVAYSPSLTFTKLGTLLMNDNQLKNNVMELINNPKFCSRLGKTPKGIQDPKVALGSLGMDNSRLLFPILMVKPLLRWNEKSTKLIAPKMWQYMILTANVTRARLVECGHKSPDQGMAIGVLRTMAHFAIANHFPQMFEDAMIEKMQHYRESNRREEYYACSEIKPTLGVLPDVIFELEKSLTRKVVESIEWSPFNIPMRNALLEDIDEVPILDRSDLGKALAQGVAYAIYDAMDRSGVFVDKHKPFWFANVQMPPDALKKIRESHPGKVDLSK